jgi:hypothetical protein
MKPVATITGRLFAAAVALALLAAAPAGRRPARRAAAPARPLWGVPQPEPATDQPYAPATHPAGRRGRPAVPGRVEVPQGRPRPRGRAVQPEPQRAGAASTASSASTNPSIEVPHGRRQPQHRGGRHPGGPAAATNTLNVGGEAADFVPFFYNYGVNAVILRNRLRSDGYDPKTDAVADARQAIRTVRAYAKEWRIDPNKIGIMGFSAGAELASRHGHRVRRVRQGQRRPGRPAGRGVVPARLRRHRLPPARRRSPRGALAADPEGTCRRRSLPARGPATGGTRFGRPNTSPRC